MMVERVRERLEAGDSLEDAVRAVRAHSVFTTHTPVPAGHDMFPPESIEAVCSSYWADGGLDRDTFFALGEHPELDAGRFHMTAAGIRLSRERERGVEAAPPGHPGAVDVPLARPRSGAPPHRKRDQRRAPAELDVAPLHGATGRALRGGLGIAPERTAAVGAGSASSTTPMLWNIHVYLKETLLDFCREQARARWIELWREAAHLVGRRHAPDPRAPHHRLRTTLRHVQAGEPPLPRRGAAAPPPHRPAPARAARLLGQGPSRRRRRQARAAEGVAADPRPALRGAHRLRGGLRAARRAPPGPGRRRLAQHAPRADGGVGHQRHEGGPELRAADQHPRRVVGRGLHGHERMGRPGRGRDRRRGGRARITTPSSRSWSARSSPCTTTATTRISRATGSG